MKIPTPIIPGQRGITILPHSEVCVHMRVAGKKMGIEVVSPRAVQLYELPAWKPFSFPVLTGEAGVFSEANGDLYYYGEGR